MSTSLLSEKSLIKATGRPWQEWFEHLDTMNARELSHPEIAAKLQESPTVSSWWAQAITVEYERKIGRREVGQSNEGDFQASTSKTLPGTMEQIFQLWQNFVKDIDQFKQVSFSNIPQTRETPKWRYWRVGLEDGSRLSILINQKTEDKVHLAVNHEKLPDAQALETWKVYWKSLLQEFQQWEAKE